MRLTAQQGVWDGATREYALGTYDVPLEDTARPGKPLTLEDTSAFGEGKLRVAFVELPLATSLAGALEKLTSSLFGSKKWKPAWVVLARGQLHLFERRGALRAKEAVALRGLQVTLEAQRGELALRAATSGKVVLTLRADASAAGGVVDLREWLRKVRAAT